MRSLGRLRHRLLIKENTGSTSNGFNEVTPDWDVAWRCWGEVKPLGAKESERNLAVQHDVSHSVRIRYKSTVTEKMRVYYGSRVFEISSVINTAERNDEMILLCNEVTNVS